MSDIPASYLLASTTNANTLDFNICLRNSLPSHLPSAAHSISPGTSIILNLLPWTSIEPICGTNVVN